MKANSIEGCKLKEVDVVYTPASNLSKSSDMEVGQVGFHDRKLVRKVKVVKDNATVNYRNISYQFDSYLMNIRYLTSRMVYSQCFYFR